MKSMEGVIGGLYDQHFFAEAGGGVRCDLLFGLYGAGGGQIYVRIVFGALERLVSSKGENFTDPRGSQ